MPLPRGDDFSPHGTALLDKVNFFLSLRRGWTNRARCLNIGHGRRRRSLHAGVEYIQQGIQPCLSPFFLNWQINVLKILHCS